MGYPEYSILKSLQEEAKRLIGKREPLPDDLLKLKKRLKNFKKNYLKCLGRFPEEKEPLNPKIEQKIIFDDTRVFQERVVYNSEKFVKVPAHVYYPEKFEGKLPGILLLQGWDLSKWAFPFLKTKLAQLGYFVLFPDNRFSGERRKLSSGMEEQFSMVPVAECLGKTFMGMNTYDNIRAIDYLLSRKEVDKEKIGVVGLCWGGMMAYNLAAIDKRVKCVVCVNSNSTYEALILEHLIYSHHSCLGTFIPDLLLYGDTIDIYALIAPRPLLLMNNSNDDWFPVSGYLKICSELEKVYKLYGKSENFKHFISSNIHDISGIYEEKTMEWLNVHLKGIKYKRS
jgi:dienelactone hydrolase